MTRTLLAVLLFAAALMRGQDTPPTVRVEITSGDKPVPNAEITAGSRTGQTGSDGMVILPAALGRIEIQVTKEGFFPAHTSLDIDAVREWTVQVELQPQQEQQENVTVYATRNDVRVQDSPLHVEVVSQDEINEEITMRPGDISMLLNEMGGMHVQTTSPGLGAASVRVQGMLGRYTAFLSDGLPLFGQQGAGLGLLQMPPMDLSQVEVIKGNASALYGSSAMAGVVNLISRRPAKEPVHEFLFNRSARGETDASMFLASRITPNWGASLLGGAHFQQHQDVDGDGWSDIAGYSRGVFRPRLYRDNHKGGTMLLTGGVIYEDRSGGTMPGAILPETHQPYVEGLKTARYDFGGNVQQVLGGRFVVSARFSASDQNHRHQFGEDIEKDRHELLFGEFSIRGAAGRNTWVAGIADERDVYRPQNLPQFAYTYTVPGLFAQDDLNLASWLSISASARLDFHNLYGTFFSPRLSALLRKGNWTSRLSAGQGFFAPTPLTEETEAAGLAKLSLPAPLRSERGRTLSADLTRTKGPLSVTATLYASNIDHPVYVERGSTYAIFNLNGATRNRGADLLATWRLAPFSVTASYNWVRATELEPSGRAEVPLTPRHNLGLVGMWEKEGVTRVGVECYYTGAQRLEYNPYRNESPSYVIAGVMAEHKVAAHVKLFVNFENLTDVRQTRWEPLLLPAREADGRWTVDAWAPLDGRVINGGARFAF